MGKSYLRDEIFLKTFGQHLRMLRESKKLSQEHLANLSDLPLSQIGRIERGEINTSLSHVAAIAKFLKVPPKDLFDF